MEKDTIVGISMILMGLSIIPFLLWDISYTRNLIVNKFYSVNWFIVIRNITIFLITIFSLYFTIKYLWRRRKEKIKKRREHEQYLISEERKLKKILETDFSYLSSYKMIDKYEKAKKSIRKIDSEITQKYKLEIHKFYKITKKEIRNKEEEEYDRYIEEQEKREIKEQKEREFQKEVQKLVEFQKKHNSSIVLPLNHNFSKEVISKAKQLTEQYIEKQRRIREIRKDAIEYYQNNSLETKPQLWGDEEEIYAQLREDIKKGKVNIKKNKVIDNTGEPLSNNFYRVKDLDEDIKNKAIAQGYEHVRGVELDGKLCGGGFYIKNPTEKETSYHFYMKYLFAELHPKMKIEHSIKGKRVDVAFISKKIKLGVEIETGKNKVEQLAEKIPWLNENFDKWIFVCSRDLKLKYSKYVDNKKSFCLTPKKAKEKVLQLCCNYNE